MSLREWANKNSVFVTVGAIVMLALALGVVALQFRNGELPTADGYWYELETDTWFDAPRRQRPPIQGPSGEEAVRAHLYSCGECTPDQWFGYLETMSEEYQRAEADGRLEQMIATERVAFEQAQHLVRLTNGGTWVSRESPRGQQLMRGVRDRCDDYRDFTECRP